MATAGEIHNAVAVLRLAEQNPEGARRELVPVLAGIAPIDTQLALVEAYLLEALACRDLADEQGTWAAVDRALDLAEPDRLIFPFAMTGASDLLMGLPPQHTAHAALVSDILDATRGDGTPVPAPTPEPVDQLSPAEMRVLRYLPTNLTRPEIADRLSVSLNTVNTHVRHIYLKLGATDRSSAVERGRELRLLSSGRA